MSDSAYQMLINVTKKISDLKLPAKNKVMHYRQAINAYLGKKFDLQPTVCGTGCRAPLRSLVTERLLEAHHAGILSLDSIQKIEVLLQGDGSNISSQKGCVLISIKLMNLDDTIIHQTMNLHPCMILNGHEGYDYFELALEDLWDDVEELNANGVTFTDANDAVLFGGRKECEFSLSGDMKFLWLVLGFSMSPSGKHRCFLCNVHKAHYACVTPKWRPNCTEHKDWKQVEFFRVTRSLADLQAQFAGSDEKLSDSDRILKCTRMLYEKEVRKP